MDLFKRKLSRGDSADSDPNLLSCHSASVGLRTVSVCVRAIDTDVINEQISYSDKKRREFLTGASAVLFLHVGGDEETDAEARQDWGGDQ